MTQDYGSCPLCGGEKTTGKTTFTVDLKFGIVVIREVPALVCDQCGEAWFEDSVAKQLEHVVSEARIKHPVVEVANWNQAIATG